MILVSVLLHFCSFLPVSTLYLGNGFPEYLGAKNLSNFNSDRSEAVSELNADHPQEAVLQSEDPVIITTLPVGAGDATIIQCPITNLNQKWFSLIDMGSRQFNPVAMNLEEYLYEVESLLGHNYELKHIFLTHPDMDHLNYGHQQITVEGQIFDIGLLKSLIDHGIRTTIHLSSWGNWMALKGEPTTFLYKFMTFLEENREKFNWNYYEPNGENVIDICGTSNAPSQVKMKIIAADLGTGSNEMSMVMSLSHQGKLQWPTMDYDNNGGKMLFLGDFEGLKQYNLLFLYEKYRKYLPADVVMAPHHGADTNGNGNPLFYDLVNARHAIISSHINHGNRHPKLTTLAAICDGFYMIDAEPYYPYGLCNVEQFCTVNDMDDMAQGYGVSSPLTNPMITGKGGCRTKIHQTTRADSSLQAIFAYKVVTNLYPHKAPTVVSHLWNDNVPR